MSETGPMMTDARSALTRMALVPAILLSAALLAGKAQDAPDAPIDLSGEWALRLDPEGVGEGESWWAQPFPERIPLPGSIQANGFGEEPTLHGPWTGGIGTHVWKNSPIFRDYRRPDNLLCPVFLTPRKLFVGAAWFQREVLIPESWTGQSVELFLERPHWKTTVWLDGRRIGRRRVLSSPHRYDLGSLEPGAYTLTVRVDNTLDPDVGRDANSVSDQTQSNWNGLAGRQELIARPTVCIRDMRLFPNVAEKLVTIELKMSTESGKGTIEIAARGTNGNPERPVPKRFDVTWNEGRCEVVYPLGETARTWNEFHPNLYEVEAVIGEHRRVETFGLREWGTKDRMFTINDRVLQLRGTLDKSIFPLTGYPATDVACWRKVMQACKDFGLNHVRYHSWCPPEAAFTAADEVGMYLMPECSLWSFTIGSDTNLQRWVLDEEMPGILESYADHPSFFALGAGNEGGNVHAFCDPFVDTVKALDPRILVTDFASTGAGKHVDFALRAIRGLGMEHSSMTDYSDKLAFSRIPVIAHETTQQAIMPDPSELKKYTGAMKPGNLELYLDIMRRNGLGPFERDIFMSEGHFQTLFYKSDIESYLRTPGYAGYQLLGLNDFTGQGTALVGALNVFWEPKAYTSAEEYRRFQGPLVVLARMPKRVYTVDETFEAGFQVAHYAERDLDDQDVTWTLATEDGHIVAEGGREGLHIAQGGVRDVGSIKVDLAGLKAPARLTLDIALPNAGIANDYDIWVYDAPGLAPAPDGVLVTRSLDDEAVRRLGEGGVVCLFPDPNQLEGAGGAFLFEPIFWNRLTFPQQQNSGKGLLIENTHPALADFPTASFSSWQWEELMNGCRPVDLSRVLPDTSRAIVQFNDCWTTGRKLGVLFEARVGAGRLLFCSMGLNYVDGRPVAAQLRRSLLAYAGSDAFQPKDELTIEQVRQVAKAGHHSVLSQLKAKMHSASSENGTEHSMDKCIDSNPYTFWQNDVNANHGPQSHWVVIELPSIMAVDGITLLPRSDSIEGAFRGCRVYVSEEPDNWGEPVDERILGWMPRGLQTIQFKKRAFGRYVKISPYLAHRGSYAIAELDILLDLDEAISQGLIDPSGFMLEQGGGSDD